MMGVCPVSKKRSLTMLCFVVFLQGILDTTAADDKRNVY